MAADSISIWMSTAVAEVYMAGKSCHILRPVPIEHEYDPVIYKDAHYVTSYPEFAAAMAQPNPVSYTHIPSPRDLSTHRMPSSA